MISVDNVQVNRFSTGTPTMTITPYIAQLRASGSYETHFLHRELRRNQLAGKVLREAGRIAYAELFEGYAEQNRLEIAALAQVEERIAALDAKLSGKEIAA
jgi:transposase